MMHQHPCTEVRERLEEYHDGELPIDQQVAIQGHLGECVGCALAATELDDLSASLRRMAIDAAPRGSDEAVRFSASVLERLGVEAQFSFVSQVRSRFQDMHLVWAGLGATIATIVCLVGSMSVLHAASQERPDSLAGVIAFLANPGSNANPMPLGVEMMAPRARLGAVIEMSEEDAVFALTAVVTREGRVQNLSVLGAEQAETLHVKHEVVLAMLSEASQAQFEPAIARGGRAIAVNMVWLLTSTTVKGRHDDTVLMVRRPWRAPRTEFIGPAPQAAPAVVPAVRLPEGLAIG